MVSTFDLVITFAIKAEFSALLFAAAEATASSINLLTWVCSSFSNVVPSSDWLSATEDKICNDRLEFVSEALEVLTIFTILSMDLISDFVIILLINSIFLDFFSVGSLPLNSWVKIFSLISLFFSESEDVINLLPVLDKPVRIPVTRSFFVSKILSIDCPTFFSSDSFKTFDRKLILSSSLFSTIKSMVSCLLVIIFSLITSTSNRSIWPSLFISIIFPLINWNSRFCWMSSSLIILTLTKSCSTSSNSFFSLSVWTLSVIRSKSTEITCFGSKSVLTPPAEETLIVPTLPKLSSDNPMS